jgi:hypothetical protein
MNSSLDGAGNENALRNLASNRMHALAASQRKRLESRHAALHAALLAIDEQQSVEQQNLRVVGKVGQKSRIERERARHGGGAYSVSR